MNTDISNHFGVAGKPFGSYVMFSIGYESQLTKLKGEAGAGNLKDAGAGAFSSL